MSAEVSSTRDIWSRIAISIGMRRHAHLPKNLQAPSIVPEALSFLRSLSLPYRLNCWIYQ
jgi:hypothetical protein